MLFPGCFEGSWLAGALLSKGGRCKHLHCPCVGGHLLGWQVPNRVAGSWAWGTWERGHGGCSLNPLLEPDSGSLQS